MRRVSKHLPALLALTSFVPAALAARLPCEPCAGVRLVPAAGAAAAPGAAPLPPALDRLVALLRAARLQPGSPLFAAWEVALLPDDWQPPPVAGAPATPPAPAGGGLEGAAAAQAVAAAGATPWLALVFRTPPPLARNPERLVAELRATAELAAAAPKNCHFQVVWRPAGQSREAAPFDAADYAFLLKRAAVAITGALPEARVATTPLPADPAVLGAFYGFEVAAYIDAVALEPAAAEALAAAVAKLHELDPGRPLVLDALPYPADPGAILAEAARRSTAGIDLTLFSATALDSQGIAPLALLAREFAGDLSYDPSSAPTGAAEAWAFVRGKDLGLRVIVVAPGGAAGPGGAISPTPPSVPAAPPPGARPFAPLSGAQPPPAELTLRFPDPGLRRPTRFPYTPGRVVPPAARVVAGGLEVRLAQPGGVAVLGLERATAAERKGVAERLSVSSEHEVQVEEILKRLQAFEDAQDRHLGHYSATNTTHLRFQPSSGSATIEVTLTGPFFWRREGGADWAWETLYINGVRWKAKTLPEIPLIQPEKAAALPLEIHFSRQYRYRLRGTDRVDGRDAWVVDFAPAGPRPAGAGGRLYQGTVWIDRATDARLRTRAVELGLEGEVISNEETLYYTPVDAAGQPAPWPAGAAPAASTSQEAESSAVPGEPATPPSPAPGGSPAPTAPQTFILPLRLVAQQILSILNHPNVVDRETVLSDLRLNGPDFTAQRQAVEQTDVTMVRDTDHGLRYLVKNKAGGERVVKEGYALSKLFAIGGVFYDDALKYPLPLAGLNYFSLDFKHTGEQLNIFFAGALLTADVAQPRLFGSKVDLGADFFAIAVPFTDTLSVKGKEIHSEELKVYPANFEVKFGYPFGNFVKAGVEYALSYASYSRTSNTDRRFVLPAANFLHSFDLDLSFARSGYRLGATGSYDHRSRWDFWGLPGNTEFQPGQQNFVRYNLQASKNWYLSHFQRIGAELDYLSGSRLDRFSKYQFGFFGGARVHGYRTSSVRAAAVEAGHFTYGFDVSDQLRLDGVVDTALATDREAGLHQRFLAGAGLVGSVIGPWSTLITLDAGVPVAGPDHGFVIYLVFLKLFH
ncbi:MAG TPA: hypothetical protein VHR45_10900 [Thermoanaerobaculia bacterium]|nr:hypothetical protein [Thermoanaerobaculia bacterium]